MDEDFYVRCSRCNAIVAVQDASSCGYHETDCLCQFCWKDHWMRYPSEEGEDTVSTCWAEQIMLTPTGALSPGDARRLRRDRQV